MPQARYRFKHTLVQDAAYQSLRRHTRRVYHQRIAQVLSDQFPEVAETEPEVVAHHYTEAGEADTAVHYWQRAGQRALERSANPEAIAHVRQGLALLVTQPETRVRLQQELDLQVLLGSALIATQGSAAADVERTYARARELCQQVEDVPQLLRVLRGLSLHDIEEGKLQTALQLAEQLLELAQTQSDPADRMLAHHMMGMTLFYCGEQVAAYDHHTQALAIDTPQAPQALAVRYGIDLGVITQSFLAWESWYLGYPDQAMQHNQAARALAQEIEHPYSLNLALFWSAFLHQWRHEAPETLAQVEPVTHLATEQGFALQASRGTVVYGWALGMTGQPEAGIAKLREGLDDYLATGGKVLRLYILALLAEVYGASGHPEAGWQALSKGLDDLTHIETHFYEAELYRLEGGLLLQQAVPDASQAETCFHRALEVARRQGAKSWELRTATSLARLWQSQGKRQDAYKLLAPLYAWFTEGFDTADLIDAKRLLDELSADMTFPA